MRKTLETLHGPIGPEELGTTLLHEHIITANTEYFHENAQLWNEDAIVSDALVKLQAAKAHGIDTIVDCTVLGLGRDITRLNRMKKDIPLNVVVATGVFTMHDTPRVFALRGPGTKMGGPEPILSMFLREIQDGIGETGVRAAFIKCVVEDNHSTVISDRVLAAVADAHAETGVPVTIHTSGTNQSGRYALQFLANRGVSPTQVVLGHAGESTDLDYHRWIADQGAFVGFDRIGLEALYPVSQYLDNLTAAFDAGLAENIVMSHDSACTMQHFIDDFGRTFKEERMPNWNYQLIHNEVIPKLLQRGVAQKDLDTVLHQNPVDYLFDMRA
ncbi:phosphotriesterase-related protein [Rhodococcus sp. OAS809]|uniref:phosphotriesterase family protein n=1 Tax=Rhodococcus sp. OAS809 TaxID=2663874 RepID=UPI00178BA264